MQTLRELQHEANCNTVKRKPVKLQKPTKKQIAKVPLTEEEHLKLIEPVKMCLKRFKESRQDANDWYVITFRLRIGKYVADRIYEPEVGASLESALALTLVMLATYRLGKGYNWSVTPEQLSTLTYAAEIVDMIQRDADRETLIFYTRKVFNEMKQYAADRSKG